MAGRGAHITEEAVEYRLFPSVPDALDARGCEKYLEEQLDAYMAHLSPYLVGYIWQEQPFSLNVMSTQTVLGPPHLFGKTKYGDNVEDEWFIVFLISQLTKAFPELIAKVSDDDGEFLLIEAANAIPKWLNPDTSVNRVFEFAKGYHETLILVKSLCKSHLMGYELYLLQIFIHQGKLHIIPRPQQPSDNAILPAGLPSLTEAVNCVRNHPKTTEAIPRIQQLINRRISQFPDQVHTNIHRGHCYIPAALAAVIDHNPQFVAPIVAAFYHRDPIDLQACVTMKHFRPGTRVMRQVKFTRCLYAQLAQQRFTPDKRSGWNLPPPSNPKFKSYDIGMKLAHGAEILCSKCSNRPTYGSYRTSNQDIRWKRFVNTLTDKGYFRGEVEGSKLYQQLFDDAQKFFFSTVIGSVSSETDQGSKILNSLEKVTFDIEEMRRQEKDLPPDESDSWMDLSPEQLDEMMNQSSGLNDASPDAFDMVSMTDSMRSFVEKMSSHEGAEIPKASEEGDIQFDPNSFIQTMQKMFEFEDPSGSSSSDMSEYSSDEECLEMPRQASKKHPKKPANNTKNTNENDYLGMKEYMDIMDKELESTTIGQSFEKKAKPPVPAKKPAAPASKPAAPRVGPPKAAIEDEFDDIDDLDDDFQAVDVDMNLVKNMLESYKSQSGTAGPASNVLGSMGVKLPPPRPPPPRPSRQPRKQGKETAI